MLFGPYETHPASFVFSRLWGATPQLFMLSKMIRAFGAIASMVAGKPIAMGEHGSHIGLSSGASRA